MHRKKFPSSFMFRWLIISWSRIRSICRMKFSELQCHKTEHWRVANGKFSRIDSWKKATGSIGKNENKFPVNSIDKKKSITFLCAALPQLFHFSISLMDLFAPHSSFVLSLLVKKKNQHRRRILKRKSIYLLKKKWKNQNRNNIKREKNIRTSGT